MCFSLCVQECVKSNHFQMATEHTRGISATISHHKCLPVASLHTLLLTFQKHKCVSVNTDCLH